MCRNQASAVFFNDDNPHHVYMMQKVTRALYKKIAPQGHEQALEWGAGTGLATLIMAKNLKHVIALENTAEQLAVIQEKLTLKKRHNVTLAEVSGMDQFSSGSFDIIYSIMAMHRIHHVADWLKQLFNFLVPGGTVALTGFDQQGVSVDSDHSSGMIHHGFDRHMFEQWLSTAGFCHIEFSTAFTAHRADADGNKTPHPIFLVIANKPEGIES